MAGIDLLRAAIANEGTHPEHHRACIKRHRAEWPTLWRAIDVLLAEAGGAQLNAADHGDDSTGHTRYDSEEFDYSGCVKCDTGGDTLGWPCPTIADPTDDTLPNCAVCGHDTWVHNLHDDWRCIPECGCKTFVGNPTPIDRDAIERVTDAEQRDIWPTSDGYPQDVGGAVPLTP